MTNSGGGAARAILFFALLLAGAAAGAHFYFVPLPVLATWLQPATLRVDSVPAGSAVMIDGVALAGHTPLETAVRRDRETHVLEVRSDGFESQRRMVRYDRTEILSESVILQPDVKRTVEQLPLDPLGQPPIDAGTTDAGTADAGTAPALASGDEAAAFGGTAVPARSGARGPEKNPGKGRASQSRPQEGRNRKVRKHTRR